MIIKLANSARTQESFEFGTFSKQRPLAKIIKSVVDARGARYSNISIVLTEEEGKKIKRALAAIIEEDDNQIIYNPLAAILPKDYLGFAISCSFTTSKKSKHQPYYQGPLIIKIEKAD